MTNDPTGLPEQNPVSDSPLRQIFRFLSSMQLGIILLLLLAVISVFATLQEHEAAIRNVYTSRWFVGIMAFTALNLLLCTVERFGPIYRQAFHPRRVMPTEAIRKMQANKVIKVKNPGDAPLSTVEGAFRANGLSVTTSEGAEGTILFAEKGRFGHFGSLVTHISLIIILLAAMFGSLSGFETRNGGYGGQTFSVPEGNFQVAIEKVTMEYSPNGPKIRPKVMSNLVVSRGSKVLARGAVAINQPLRFEGTSIYHSTFVWVAHLTVTDPETGKVIGPLKLEERDRYFLQEKDAVINAWAFFPDFTMTPQGMPTSRSYATNRPVLLYQVSYRDGQQDQWSLLEMNQPKLVETRNGPIELTLTGFENTAVYSIAKNLGRPYLFAGAVMMLAGLYMSFFLFPRRFWAVYDSKSSSYIIGGRSRNRLGLENLIDSIEESIQNREGE